MVSPASAHVIQADEVRDHDVRIGVIGTGQLPLYGLGFFPVAGDQHELRAALGQPARRREPHAGGRPGDHAELSVHPLVRRVLFHPALMQERQIVFGVLHNCLTRTFFRIKRR